MKTAATFLLACALVPVNVAIGALFLATAVTVALWPYWIYLGVK